MAGRKRVAAVLVPPSDIAPTVSFLASAGAGWITGQVLSISGGFSMVG